MISLGIAMHYPKTGLGKPIPSTMFKPVTYLVFSAMVSRVYLPACDILRCLLVEFRNFCSVDTLKNGKVILILLISGLTSTSYINVLTRLQPTIPSPLINYTTSFSN